MSAEHSSLSNDLSLNMSTRLMRDKRPFGDKWCFTLSGEDEINEFEMYAETVPNENMYCMKYYLLPCLTLRGCLQLVTRKRESQITKILQQPSMHLTRTSKWGKALEYVHEMDVPMKEFGSYKDHAEKVQMGIRKKKTGLSMTEIMKLANHKRTSTGDNALECVNAIDVPIKEIDFYKDHAEKVQMGIWKKKTELSAGEIVKLSNHDERLMEFTNMFTNSSNIENTELAIFESKPSIVGEISRCQKYALMRRRQELLRTQQTRAHQATLYDWQREIEIEINRTPNQRTIFHYVDPTGGKGKSFIQKNLKDKYPERIFQFTDGKAVDVYHQIHKHQTKYGHAPDIIFYNITRSQHFQGQDNFINYGAIEDIKDGLVKSMKYDGGDVFFENNPHVYIFSNHCLEYHYISFDRWRKRTFIKGTKAVKTQKIERVKKVKKGFTYTWQDLYFTDDHIKQLSLIPSTANKGTLDVTPVS